MTELALIVTGAIKRVCQKVENHVVGRVIQVGAGIVALSVMIWIVINRSMEPVELWWWTVIVMASLVIFATYRSLWRSSSLIFASLLSGFAAQLVFTDPNWFQVVDLTRTRNFHYFAQFAIAGQALVALLFVVAKIEIDRLPVLRASVFRPTTILVLLLVLVFSASSMRYFPGLNFLPFASQAAYGSGFLALNTLSIVALILNVPSDSRDKLSDTVTQLFAGSPNALEASGVQRAFLYGCAVWLFLASSILCLFAFEQVPHVDDELVYLFQAKTLIAGELWAPLPVLPEAFEVELLGMQEGRWYAITAFGWPLVLSIGAFFDLPWLINPTLAVISLLLTHSLICRIADRATANVAILLLSTSPWFIAMSASLMTHTLTAALAVGAWGLLANGRGRKPLFFAFIAGALMGYLFLTRHLDGLVIGGVTGIWLLYEALRDRRIGTVISYGVGCLAIGAWVFPFNSALTGDPLLTPLNDYLNQIWYEGANRIGFGNDVGPAETWGAIDPYAGHSIFEAIINFQHNTYITNLELFGIGTASLVFAAIHILKGSWTNFDRMMAAIVMLSVVVYSLYWFSGGFYIGARYWFLIFIPLIYLSARGLRTGVELSSKSSEPIITSKGVAVSIVALCIASQVCYLPWRSIGRYHEFRGGHSDYRDLIAEYDLSNSIVFFKSDNSGDTLSALHLNSPFLRGAAPIFARDLGDEKNALVLDAFPLRKSYQVEGRLRNDDHVRFLGEQPLPK